MEPLNNESPGIPGQTPASSAPPPLGFEDRSTGLLIFGVFEIIGGVLAALEVPAAWFFLLSPKFPRPPGSEMSPRSVVLNCASWAAAAVVLITLGLGAMRARRWAWALNLILSWLGLVAGTITVGSMWIATKPGGMGRFMLGPALLMPGIAGLFLLFYRSNDVEQTCKHRDPVERWTDRQPLPVLAAVLLAAWGAACGLAWNHTPHVAAFFGRYLTGLPASALLLLWLAADVYVAFALFKMKPSGWWVAVAAVSAQILSMILTVRRTSPLDAMTMAGWPKEKIDLTQQVAITGIWTSIAFGIAHLLFLIWLGRYFRRAKTERSEEISSGYRAGHRF
jgi:hypothetical protein